MKLGKSFWEERYLTGRTGWDLGGVSPQLIAYFNTLPKDLMILIPGCGHGHEAVWLESHGFEKVTVIDLAAAPLAVLAEKTKKVRLVNGDFFDWKGKFDLIIEQTFFCALDPSLRKRYVQKMAELLNPVGRLAGLLFCIEFEKQGPPFGGSVEEYKRLFEPYFELLKMEPAELSVKPRLGSEVFFEAKLKAPGDG